MSLAACGLVGEREVNGSETHWLERCDSDADCGGVESGASCQAGYCTPSAPVGDESGDVDPAVGSADTGEADLTEFMSPVLEPAADTSPVSSILCDGSDELRIVYFSREGYASDPYWSGPGYGPSFFAIDGRCRFWQAPDGSGTVFTGVIANDVAEAFAADIHFGRQTGWSDFRDDECLAPGQLPISDMWTPQGSVRIGCDPERPDAPTGWADTWYVIWGERLGARNLGLFDGGQALAGPARFALVELPTAPEYELREAWPLARPPAENEFWRNGPIPGGVTTDMEWGVLIDDERELAQLRAARQARDAVPGVWQYTPLLWPASNSQAPEELYMRLQDEVPEPVKAKLALMLQY